MVTATYRKNISPGNDIYIISRFVHSPVLFLIMKPTRPPTKTPITVAIVSTFSCIKLLNLLLASCLGLVILTVVYVNDYSARGSTHFQVTSHKLTFGPVSQSELPPCRDLRDNYNWKKSLVYYSNFIFYYHSCFCTLEKGKVGSTRQKWRFSHKKWYRSSNLGKS